MKKTNYKINYIKNSSYEEYKKNQIIKNKQKINNKWIREENVVDIKKYCDSVNLEPSNIICHGTRNGAEIKFFQKYFPNSKTIGTEISDTAKNYPDTIEWDFHDIKPDWIGKFDIVFTNSWDHSYDLDKAVTTWMQQLSDKGILVLDWSSFSTSKPFDKADCCGCSLEDLKAFLSEKGKVVDIITKGHLSENSYLVITSKI